MSNETILKRLKIIEDLQDEINKMKAVCDESLENDALLQEVNEEAEKVKEQVKAAKEKVMNNPTTRDLTDQMKQLRDELKENREILAQELADYYKESGKLEIEDTDGNTKRIKFSAKLISS